MARTRSRALAGFLASVVVAVAACGEQPLLRTDPPKPTASIAAQSGTPNEGGLAFPLPTARIDACAGVLFDGPIILEISEGVTAGRHLGSGRVFPMLWPRGFTARFDPPAWRIIDDQGRPFATTGEDIGPFMRSSGWGGWDTCPTLEYLIVYCGSATCSSTGPGSNPIPPPSDLPRPTPDLPAQLPSLGDTLLVVGYSDAYLLQAERDVEAPASLVVWDSGLLVGNPRYEGFRAVQLTQLETQALRRALLAAELITLSLPNEDATGDHVVCRDCAVTIIRTDVSGDTVEVAVWGLVPELRPGFEDWQLLPEGVVRVRQLIEELWARIRADSAMPWPGDVPTLPISGLPTGG